jgi:cobyric acid synthase
MKRNEAITLLKKAGFEIHCGMLVTDDDKDVDAAVRFAQLAHNAAIERAAKMIERSAPESTLPVDEFLRALRGMKTDVDPVQERQQPSIVHTAPRSALAF